MVRVPKLSWTVAERRRRKIERQLRALRVMQSHISTKELWWAILTIPGAALLFLLLAAKLHWLSNSAPFAIIGAMAAGFAVWWVGRRWFTVSIAIVFALICILTESPLDFGGTSAETNKKMNRRQKLESAIARREALLRAMDAAP